MGQWEAFSVAGEESYNAYFTDVFAVDSTIWIIDTNEKIHRSINNGLSWETYETGVLIPSSIYFLDQLCGFVIGRNGETAKTNDGGETWVLIESGTLGYNDLTDIHFIENTGWVIGRQGTFYQTVDRGNSWTQKSLPNIPSYWLDLTDIYFFSKLEGYILGYGNGYFKTVDGGTTWRYYSYRINGVSTWIGLKRIFFKNQLEGWATNESDVYKTKDSGISWHRVSSWDLWSVKDIYFLNEQFGWAIHNDGDISRTTNGGDTWVQERRNMGRRYALENITFDDNGNGWTIGN
ncbi:MAG: WD40/YVTN/BNR-like repeat-containing protein, partial [Saprospiraceae bacterium]